ncbi:hypothetical protein ACO2Q7_17165 [Rathayibacter sp. KR2-224]|uniref:hypothetical protein n=1 Tax=Rathayibacter sp. KR2-224 TaxID=3400913 RepID=UPI003C0514B8
MSDVEGLEEFGGLARWRDVLLHFPKGPTEPHRLERFVLVDGDAATPVYEWREIEED